MRTAWNKKRTEEKRREKYHKCQKQWVSQQMMKGRRDKKTEGNMLTNRSVDDLFSLSLSSFSCKESALPSPSHIPCGAAFRPHSRICEANKTRNNRQSGGKMMAALTWWSSSHTTQTSAQKDIFCFDFLEIKHLFSKLKFTHCMSYEQCFSFCLKRKYLDFHQHVFVVVFDFFFVLHQSKKRGEWEQK